jgi:hypothetical protein
MTVAKTVVWSILVLIVLSFVALTVYIVYIREMRKVDPETCKAYGERTGCFNIIRTHGTNHLRHKYTRIKIDPIYNGSNRLLVYDMVVRCSFNPRDLIAKSIMFGAGEARPHSLKVNRSQGTMIARFYTTYRTLTFDITPNLNSVQVDSIHLEAQTKY